MARRKCCICHMSLPEAYMRVFSSVIGQVAVLLSAMVLFCGASPEELKVLYMDIKRRKEMRRLCDVDFIEVGQPMTTEVTSSGGILYYSEGVYYVLSCDIPQQLLTNLQGVLSGFDDSFVLGEDDISTFLNSCLSHHYNGKVWRDRDLKFPMTDEPQPTQVVVEEVLQIFNRSWLRCMF